MTLPKDFNALVTWACWHVIQGITKGEPIEKSIYVVLDAALRWRAEQESK